MQRYLLFVLFVLGLLASAQIAEPLAALAQYSGIRAPLGNSFSYQETTITPKLLGRLVEQVGYVGPVADTQVATKVLVAATADPGIAQPFQNWLSKNTVWLGQADGPVQLDASRYRLSISLGKALEYTLGPFEAPRGTLDSLSHITGAKGLIISEFSDFECPHYRRLAAATLPGVMNQYAATGKAHFAYYQFPLMQIYPQAMPAVIVSECAVAQGNLCPYHHALFNSPLGDYSNLAKGLAINIEKFEACTKAPAARAAVNVQLTPGKKLSVNSAPTVFVGPFKLPNPYGLNAYKRYLQMAAAVE